MEYSIGAFSKKTGISIHTLRYYEKEELITVGRKSNGRRYYTDSDIAWIDFIKRLKETNMPIKEIRTYAFLRAQGAHTLKARLDLLNKHRLELVRDICEKNENLSMLDDKIDYYNHEIAKQMTD